MPAYEWAIFYALCVLFSGCTTVSIEYKDSQKSQPIAGAGEIADGWIYFKDTGWGGEHWLEWRSSGRTYDSRSIVELVDDVADEIGVRSKPSDLPSFANKYQTPMASHTLYIVSLDPIVVISCPLPIEYRLSYSVYDSNVRDRRASIQLPRGIKYGSVVPCREDITWFAPELTKEPAVITYPMSSPDTGMVKTSWGSLVIYSTRRGWAVRSVREGGE